MYVVAKGKPNMNSSDENYVITIIKQKSSYKRLVHKYTYNLHVVVFQWDKHFGDGYTWQLKIKNKHLSQSDNRFLDIWYIIITYSYYFV